MTINAEVSTVILVLYQYFLLVPHIIYKAFYRFHVFQTAKITCTVPYYVRKKRENYVLVALAWQYGNLPSFSDSCLPPLRCCMQKM
jgi:hypothetical protein